MSVDRGGSDRHPVTAHRLPLRLAYSPDQVGRGAGRHPPRRIHPRPGVQVRGVCRRGLQPDAHPGMRRRAGRPSLRRSQPSGPAIRPPPVAATAFRTVRVGRRPRWRAALCGAWGAALRGADGSKNTPCILSGPGAEKLQPQPVSADGEGGTIGGRNRSPPRVTGPGSRGAVDVWLQTVEEGRPAHIDKPGTGRDVQGGVEKGVGRVQRSILRPAILQPAILRPATSRPAADDPLVCRRRFGRFAHPRQPRPALHGLSPSEGSSDAKLTRAVPRCGECAVEGRRWGWMHGRGVLRSKGGGSTIPYAKSTCILSRPVRGPGRAPVEPGSGPGRG